MADKLGAQTTVLRSREGVTGDGRVAEVLVRRVPDDQQFLDLRVVCFELSTHPLSGGTCCFV